MKKIIALDIGGTNFRCAVFDENYKILKREVLSTTFGNKDIFYQNAISLVSKFVDEDVIAISIGVPGRVRNDGFINALPNVGLNNIDFVTVLKEKFNLPIYVKNDAEAACVGEANLGAGKGKKSLFFITVSTGVGAALAINGKYRISSYEMGHTIIPYKKKFYEIEELISGTGLKNLAKINGLKVENSKHFFDLVEIGNSKTGPILEEWIKLFEDFLKTINKNFEPEIISLTGGMMKSSKHFLEKIKKDLNFEIKLCELGEDAGLIGAAVIGFEATK